MKDNSDYFNQFWLGNITLWKSYWIWGTAFSFVVGFILGFIGVLLQAPFIIVIGIIAWTIYVSVGVWRSSDKYKGPEYWAWAAKIMIVIGCLYNASQLHTFL